MKLLSSPEAMHASVQSAFPPGSLEATMERALWRVDRASGHEVSLYIVSPIEPDLSHVVEQAGWQNGAMWQTRAYRPLLERLAPGQRWLFRLRANPVFRGYKAGKEWADTKPLAHVTVKQHETWLLDRAANAGFRVPDGPLGESDLRVTERSILKFFKGGHRVTIAVATFDGVLEVVDPPAMAATLTKGLGRAKAYGCGLMTLAAMNSGG